MAQNSLSEYLLLINHQLISQEILLDYHRKAEAMLEVLLGSNLPNYSYVIIHDYLWGLSDIIKQAKNLNEDLLNVLIKVVALTKPPKSSPGSNRTIH